MKHLFDVTSHLTFSIMHRVVQMHNIPADDCILLLVRSYTLADRYKSIYKNVIQTSYNVDSKRGRVFAGWRVWQTQRNIKEFDEQIDAFLRGESFVWYTPVCSNDLCSLVVTKTNCQGYYVIEDGLASYRDYNPQTFTGLRYVVYSMLLKPLWPRIFSLKNHFVETEHPKFRGCIATLKECFPLHNQYLQLIGLPFEPTPIQPVPDAIISVDPLYQFVDVSKAESVYRRLEAYIDKHHTYKKIAYKFHPRFYASSNQANRQIYEGLIKQYFPAAFEIGAEVILENVLAFCKADFYSFNSSIAIYASLAGARCYNIAPLLKDTPAYERVRIIDQCTISIESE